MFLCNEHTAKKQNIASATEARAHSQRQPPPPNKLCLDFHQGGRDPVCTVQGYFLHSDKICSHALDIFQIHAELRIQVKTEESTKTLEPLSLAKPMKLKG